MTQPPVRERDVEALRAYAACEVAIGEQPGTAIVQSVLEVFDCTADVVELAWRIVAEQITAHVTAQQSWPPMTDCDRMRLAFRELDLAGIVARESFACCQSCGVAEIGEDLPEAENPRGYAFFHRQDTQHAAEGNGLYLSYGSLGEATDVAIGAEVAETLRRHDVPVEWDGDAATRIFMPLRWQRRRLGRLAAAPVPSADDPTTRVVVLEPDRGGYAPPEGELPAAVLVDAYLPWLPAGTSVGISVQGSGSVWVERRGGTLVATLDDRVVTVGRRQGMELVHMLGGSPSTRLPAPAEEPGLVEVTFDLWTEQADRPVPLEAAACVDLLRRLAPRTQGFACFETPGGALLQTRWHGDRLWMESPEPDRRRSLGRYVTLADAEQTITILAGEGRIALADLGELEQVPWA